MRLRRILPTLATVSVAFGIASSQLFFPPIVGLANNGDFESVMGYVGFRYVTEDRSEKYFSWIVSKFAFGDPGWFQSGLITSETLLAGLARLVAEPFARGGIFDIRVLGAIHALLLVAGLGLLVSATAPLRQPARWVAATLLVFFFTDVGYVAPLNSFFSQAASLVFLLLTLGIAARSLALGERNTGHALLFFVSAALFVGSKPQEAVQGFLLALFGLRLYGSRAKGLRQPAVWAAIALAAFSIWYLRSTPPAIAEVAPYHKVFMELLPNSPTPERDLEDLGLDPAWVSAMGKIAYAPDSPYADPAFRKAFLERFSYARLAGFYLIHPSRLASTLSRGGQQALRLRHPRFGNLEHRPGVAPSAKSNHFSVWSDMRLALPGHPLLWIVPFYGANLVLALMARRRAPATRRLASEGILLLAAMGTTAFLVCVLSNAHGDLPRHFYVFHAICDLLLAIDLSWAIQFTADRLATTEALATT